MGHVKAVELFGAFATYQSILAGFHDVEVRAMVEVSDLDFAP